MTAMNQPLSGTRIVDFSSLVPGPLATRILQDAGAEVIRVTRPEGDPMAAFPPLVDGVNVEHCLLIADKTPFAADLRDPADMDRVLDLIGSAGVLVEGFRPGVMDRLGLGYEALKAKHPGLIYCSISGYGQTGPNRLKPGHDLNYQAECGLLAMSPGTLESPSVPAALVADIAGGTYPAVINILLALLHRTRTGNGAHIDIAMADGAATFLLQPFARRQVTGRDPVPGSEMLTGGEPRYALYPTRDGRLLAVGAIEEKFWTAFCDTVGLPLDADHGQVRAAILQDTAEGWSRKFGNTEACVSVVATLSEALESEQFRSRGLADRKVEAPAGTLLDAVPTPVSPIFRRPVDYVPKTAIFRASQEALSEDPQPPPEG